MTEERTKKDGEGKAERETGGRGSGKTAAYGETESRKRNRRKGQRQNRCIRRNWKPKAELSGTVAGTVAGGAKRKMSA